jgi:hypothetical protein
VLATDAADQQKPRLVDGLRRNLDQIRIVPEPLSFDEVDAV